MNRAIFYAAVEARRPAALDFLRDLVAINSFSANAAGVNANADRIAAAFAPLGFAAERVATGDGAGGRHLFLRGPEAAGRPTLALLSHLDTVYPPEEEQRNGFIWREDGARIYGPGTSDIKGGTAAIWLLLTAFCDGAPETFAAAHWIVALNAREEVDSADFGAACVERFPVDMRGVLIFEADGTLDDGWGLVAARKGRATFTVRVRGRGAHAGGRHGHGANAVVQLARVVDRLAGLTDYAAGVTVNVGTIRGGTVNNRVPHAAEATLELRAWDPAAFAAAQAEILALAGDGDVRSADGYACAVEVTPDDACAPWPRNPATEALLAHWDAAAAETGGRVMRQERGGLSDGNVLWSRFPTIDGLGPRGGDEHCSERSADGTKVPEWVDATSFAPKTCLNGVAIARLLGF